MKSRENEISKLGSQRPSPNVKTLCNFELQIWTELSIHVMPKMFVLKVHGRHVMCFLGQTWPEKSHHVMDVFC